jgi:hypothetical protein
MVPTELLARAEPMLGRCAMWNDRGWRHGGRAEAAFAAVCTLADLAADVEGRPRRPVPRLEDLALVDQLAVMVFDIARTEDESACEHAGAIIAGLERSLRD